MRHQKYTLVTMLAILLVFAAPYSPLNLHRVWAQSSVTLIAFQSGVAQPFNNANSGSVSLPVTSGNQLLIVLTVDSCCVTPVQSVADNLGNSYIHLAQNPAISSFVIDTWSSHITIGGTATITATLSNNVVTRFVFAVAQYSGVQRLGPTNLNAGNGGTVIDTNQYNAAFSNDAGTHWGVGLGGAGGTGTMSANSGTLRVSAVTSQGSGDVSAGIADLTGWPGATVDPKISLSQAESSYAAFIDLVPFLPPSIAFESAVAQPYNHATSGVTNLRLVQGDLLVVGVSVSGGFYGAVSSITDSKGNTYSHIGTNPANGAGIALDLWEATVTHSGNAVITVTLSISATEFVIAVSQYSGANGFGQNSFNAGNSGTVIDTNQYHITFNQVPGTHWGIGVGGSLGTATLSQNNGTLRVSAVTTQGSGDVGAGIADLKGQANTFVDPLINLSSSETSYAAMVELIPYPGA